MKTRDTFLDAMANELPVEAIVPAIPDYIKSREDNRMSSLLIVQPPAQSGKVTFPIAEGAQHISDGLLDEAESSDIPRGTAWYVNTRPDETASGAVVFNLDEFELSTAQRWAAGLVRILTGAIGDPDQDWRRL
jgi:hypothetical protein